MIARRLQPIISTHGEPKGSPRGGGSGRSSLPRTLVSATSGAVPRGLSQSSLERRERQQLRLVDRSNP